MTAARPSDENMQPLLNGGRDDLQNSSQLLKKEGNEQAIKDE